jgi:hypothetical protein
LTKVLDYKFSSENEDGMFSFNLFHEWMSLECRSSLNFLVLIIGPPSRLLSTDEVYFGYLFIFLANLSIVFSIFIYIIYIFVH